MEPIILSDEDDPSTPFPVQSKKRRTEPAPNQTIFLVDDDPTPQKPRLQHGAHSSSTPSFVAETPMSLQFDSEVAIVKCIPTSHSDPNVRVSTCLPNNLSGISQMICLESDNESENSALRDCDENETRGPALDLPGSGGSRWTSNLIGSGSSPERHSLETMEMHISSGNDTQTENSWDNPSNPTSSQLVGWLLIS
ncbi:hypothetical protein Ahy_B03g063561 isoform C [Arachis hypogaea]|uniref:Uncharacterized protein n=1 Tax=Arachis hypogaea TaxID=3818 RepID=A0A444ZXI6_ARAHY|nr:hypothetical protein Ahy_B03g063561 isoform C [Arachis hypogaea]